MTRRALLAGLASILPAAWAARLGFPPPALVAPPMPAPGPLAGAQYVRLETTASGPSLTCELVASNDLGESWVVAGPVGVDAADIGPGGIHLFTLPPGVELGGWRNAVLADGSTAKISIGSAGA